MRRLGVVAELWRYPVKSMGGEPCDQLRLEERGAVGDRVHAVRDDQGRLGSGKHTRRFTRLDGLLDFTAMLTDGIPAVRCPDGRVLKADDPELHGLLSARFGRPMTVMPEREGSHMDAAPLHLLTTAALQWLETPDGRELADVRRFRPNVLVRAEGDQPVEHDWPGYRLRIGDVVELLVVGTTERCRMVTLAQGGLPEAPGLLRRIARDADLQLGVYADVLMPGEVRTGDAVYVLD
ncbi:MAG: MOSC domain-containing protein [Ectothiorhodospiraceae bacterium]|nr:MOSC domain-containing protein [Ectothiorhodospiraceae bacterium]